MKIITLLTLVIVLLLALSGALPQSSVGGGLVLTFIFLVAALAVGLHEAWSNKRGVLGWIVNIVAALVGCILGAFAGSFVLDLVLTLLQPEGSLMASGQPLLYVSLAAMTIFALLGSWTALWIVNRFR